jgi:hypothetical protein
MNMHALTLVLAHANLDAKFTQSKCDASFAFTTLPSAAACNHLVSRPTSHGLILDDFLHPQLPQRSDKIRTFKRYFHACDWFLVCPVISQGLLLGFPHLANTRRRGC